MSQTGLQCLQDQLQQLAAQGLRRQLVVADTPCAPEVVVNGQTRLAFNSNDYLGLANDPRIIASLQEGAARYGVGSGASHLISGHSRAHAALEERLASLQAAHIPQVRALYFCTGFMANLAVLGALADIDRPNCAVFSETLNHASLIDGIRLARVPCQLYPHNDVAALADLLAQSTARQKIVVTDSVFSMDGDVAPLRALLALCEQHDAWLLVDDAHGFGVLGGNGHGVLQHLGLHSSNLVYMGTLGKAAGVGGAFVAAHERLIDWMIQRARPYIYTTAAPPALAHALQTSLDILTSDEGDARRQHLQNLIQRFAHDPRLTHLQRPPSDTAVQPVVLGSNDAVLAASAQLQDQGLWITAIRAPTVPVNTARLRITLSAAHTEAQLERLIVALAGLPVSTACASNPN
jgi:8-amino-7-oxononanoate synthase